MASRSRRGIELLVAAVAVLLVLVAGELGLRLLPKFDPQPRAYVGRETNLPHEYLVPDPELGWRMAPNGSFVHETPEYKVTYRSNAEGYRDDRPFTPAADGEQLVTIVGDSFSFGWGVEQEQTFGALVDAQLTAARVYNFALPGYAIDQMWLSERQLALPLHPKLLIVAFISDDFTRSLTAYRYNMHLNKPAFTLDHGTLRPRTAQDHPPDFVWTAVNYSRVWVGVRELLRLLGHRYPVGEWWQLNRALLDRIRADGEAAGARVLFVYWVTREPRPFPALTAYMRETSADFLDLGNGSPPPGLNYPGDAHPNPDGHRYVADALLAWIRREMPELAAAPAS